VVLALLPPTAPDGQEKGEEERPKQIARLTGGSTSVGWRSGNRFLPCCFTCAESEMSVYSVHSILLHGKSISENNFSKSASAQAQLLYYNLCDLRNCLYSIELFETLILLVYFARGKVQQMFAESCKKILGFKVQICLS